MSASGPDRSTCCSIARIRSFIVSRDLSYFAHEHPQRVDGGAFELRQRLPAGGYMLAADFLPQGGTPQMLQRAIVTEGYRGRLFHVPRDKSTRGPSLTFDPVLPAPGKYKLWVQFQRRARVITVPFVIDVRSVRR